MITIYHDDCLNFLSNSDEKFDAIVTDPPYGLEFMGNEWDKLGASATHRENRSDEMNEENKRRYIAAGVTYGKNARAMQDWHHAWAVAALRVAKPGAHLLVFGGTRTHHRLMCAIEDAGWEIRDVIMWVYGSGFPKSLNVSKAIDKAAGAEREVVGEEQIYADGSKPRKTSKYVLAGEDLSSTSGRDNLTTAPATEAAKQWDGWGTALKPAYEPIILARKPLEGTVAQNVIKYCCGGLNIDGCRVGSEEIQGGRAGRKHGSMFNVSIGDCVEPHSGRWPANFLHDGSNEVCELFLESDSAKSKTPTIDNPGTLRMNMSKTISWENTYNDSGSAARFFYCAKASKSERGSCNSHPTVKPLSLMRYLCKLITPKGGKILDPFCGSGSTLIAAKNLGFDAVGVEKEIDWFEISEARVKFA